jgi:hypothetical protein
MIGLVYTPSFLRACTYSTASRSYQLGPFLYLVMISGFEMANYANSLKIKENNRETYPLGM